ncbi:MAG: PQQ-like domain, partial [Phenylobacterium sp.]|nr:PQQ-like domain [Phenylobacterium sp.]
MNRTVRRARKLNLLGVAAAAVAALTAATAALGAETSPGAARVGSGVPVLSEWTSSGQNNQNTRYAAVEHSIDASNVGGLKPKWIFTTAGDVSATATVVNGIAYVPDWGGKLWAIDTRTGKAVWSKDVSDYTGTAGAASRTSPAYWNGELVIGTGNLMTPALDGAFEVGLNARTGAMLWRTKIGDSVAIITGSATIDNGVVYTGISSKTEHTNVSPVFRGSVVALDARTGKILWTTYMTPTGFNGAAVWSSQPVVDHKTGLLYVTTGNSYTVPKGYCVNPGDTKCTRLPPDAHIDSVVALRLTTGKIAWSHHTLTADTWTMADPNASPDFDFGAGP